MLSAEPLDRKPLASLFPGRVGSCSLLKYSSRRELPLRGFPKQDLAAVLLAGLGASRVRVCLQARNSGGAGEPAEALAAFIVEAGSLRFSCSVHRCLSVCYSGPSHQPSVTILPSVELRAWGQCHARCYSIFNSSASHVSIV